MTELRSDFFHPEKLAHWLEASHSINIVQAGEQLYKALRELRKSSDPAKNVELFLQLTPAVLRIVEGILITTHNNTHPKNHKLIQLCLQLCRNICLGLYAHHAADVLTTPQKTQLIYFALQMAGQELLIRHRFKSLPSQSLWRISGELYLYAQQHALLNEPVAHKIPEFIHQKNIDSVIKRNILLLLSATREHSPPEIHEISEFARHYGDLLTLVSSALPSTYFYWPLANGLPTQITPPLPPPVTGIVFIDTHALEMAITAGNIKLALPAKKQQQLFYALTGYQKLIHDVQPGAPIIFKMLAGFGHCFQYLLERQKTIRIQQLSHLGDNSHTSSEQAPVDNYLLEPLDFETGFLAPELDETLPPLANLENDKTGTAVKFHRAADPDYLLIEGKNLNLRNGELILLRNNKNALLAGIVRQQKQLSHLTVQLQRVLIEKIPGELTAHYYRPHAGQQAEADAIFINESTPSPEILLSDGNYKPGEHLTIANKKIHLQALKSYTPYLFHYDIALID